MQTVLLVLGALALLGVRGAEAGGVAVVPLGQGAAYRQAARAAVALRQRLEAKGQTVCDPALALAAVTPPQDVTARAQAVLRAGLAAYEGLEFAQARKSLQEALTLQRKAMRQGGAAADYIKILHYLAAAAFYEEDKADAARHYIDAAAFAPAQAPDRNVFSPDVLKIYAEAQRSARASLQITTRPSAEAHLNGKYIGVSPVTIAALAPGRYLLSLRRPGYHAEPLWVAVEPGAKAEVNADLKTTAVHPEYRKLLQEASAELAQPRPGPAVSRLQKRLDASSLVLIVHRAGRTAAAWAEGGLWSRQHQATVAEGEEAAFADGLLGAVQAMAAGGCQQADCGVNESCVGGRCVRRVTSTPVYKRWWFWTIIGATVAAGATVGVVLGLRGRSGESWSAEVVPGGLQ